MHYLKCIFQRIIWYPVFELYTGNRGGMCGEGLENHSIQTIQFNSIGNEILHCIHVLLREIRGECQHAVCHGCHEKHSTAQKRSRSSVLSDDDLNKSCHHQTYNIKLYTDIWWCTKEHLGGLDWSERAKRLCFL